MRNFLCLVAVAMALLGASAAPKSVRAEVLRVSFNQDLCIDLNQSNSRLMLYQCHGGANQDFFTRTYGVQRFNGQCLDQGSNSEGAYIIMRACNGQASQRWGVFSAGSGLVTLKNEAGWCSDIPGGNAFQGQYVKTWRCNQGANQSWAMGPFRVAQAPAPAAPVAAASGRCNDQWITQAMQEVLGRAPNGSGTAGECNPSNYGRGQWTSYRDLLNKVTVRMTGKGAAYTFVAPRMAVIQGHIGWAYVNDDGSYSYGSTDAPMALNPLTGNWGGLAINPGPDTNTPWRGVAWTEQELFQAFKGHYATDTYNEVKHTFVASRRPAAAEQMARDQRGWGYLVATNNCLDHTYKVLQSYGVQEGQVMMWMQTRPAPNSWFRAMGRMDLNGRIYTATNTPGERL